MVRGSLMLVRMLAWLLLFQWSVGAGWAAIGVPEPMAVHPPICGVAAGHDGKTGGADHRRNGGADHRRHDGAADPCCWAHAVPLGLAGPAGPSLRPSGSFVLVAPPLVRSSADPARPLAPQQPRAPPTLS